MIIDIVMANVLISIITKILVTQLSLLFLFHLDNKKGHLWSQRPVDLTIDCLVVNHSCDRKCQNVHNVVKVWPPYLVYLWTAVLCWTFPLLGNPPGSGKLGQWVTLGGGVRLGLGVGKPRSGLTWLLSIWWHLSELSSSPVIICP